MGCLGDKEKGELEDSQKWAYVTLSDFKATGALAYFSYAWLWFLAIVAVAVYGADTFTAVNLLAYDKWSSQIEPALPLKYSKWIFAACIFVSWALCAFEWVRAIRVIRRGSVAESYMDPLAATLQSMRPRGWKRFLVFAELTKSKKGVDYIALFVYFSFKGALRIILAEAPRQVINGITLYSFMDSEIVPTGTHAASSGHSSFEQFFLNIEVLAETDREQAVVLFTMMFTLVIWVISALSLLAAVILYLVFLWHYIPQEDGRLRIYCRRKIDRRLCKIVSAKVRQALEDQEKERLKKEALIAKNREMSGRPVAKRQPTLPHIPGTTPRFNDEKLPPFNLVRQASEATFSSHSSQSLSTRNDPFALPRQPPLSRQPTIPDIHAGNKRPYMPSRSGTQASSISSISQASDAPLLWNATDMGRVDDRSEYMVHQRSVLDRGTTASPYTSGPSVDVQAPQSVHVSRTESARQMSASSYSSRPFVDRQTSAVSYTSRRGPDRQDSASSHGSRPGLVHQTSTSSHIPWAPLMRPMTPLSEVSSQATVQYMGPAYNVTTLPCEYQQSGASPLHDYIAAGTLGATTMSPHQGERHHQTLAPPNNETYQTSFVPSHEQLSQQDKGEMMVPVESNALSHSGVQMFHRPFSPPARAATAMSFADQDHDDRARFGQAFEMTSRLQPQLLPQSRGPNEYVAFNPAYTMLPAQSGHDQTQQSRTHRRNLTSPMHAKGPDANLLPQRSATAPPETGLYDDIINEYERGVDVDVLTRSATAGPSIERR